MTMFDLKSVLRGDDVDAHEQLTTTAIGCRTEGEEVVEVSEALHWREGELHPEQPGSMGSREADGGFGAPKNE